MVSKAAGLEMSGKVFVKDKKVRNENQMAGQTNVMIINPDKQQVLVIMPQQKMYLETPLNEDPQQKMMTLTDQDKPNMKLVGTETLNGYECDKHEITVSHQGQSTKHCAWMAKKLGMPIKIVSEGGAFSMEYQDIKPGPVAASPFEPPPGFRKMQMPVPIPSMK